MTDSATKTEAIQKPKRTDFETNIIAIQKPKSMIQKPKCTIQNHSLRFRNQNLAATPPDHYVASWTSQEINTPPCSLTTMLHVELHKRSKPRHALWPLFCMLNFTRDQSPATPSDHYVACWTSQEIKAPPRPLTILLHVELHKRSKPRHPLCSLCPWCPADCTVQNREQTHPLCSTHWSSQIDG